MLESKPFSRLGLFSKGRNSEASTETKSKDKRPKKGPSAGTGHERYGRFALRGRSSSTTIRSLNTTTGRTSSADSAIGSIISVDGKSSIRSQYDSDFEGFLAEREKPVTVRGGQAARPPLGRFHSDVAQAREDPDSHLHGVPNNTDGKETPEFFNAAAISAWHVTDSAQSTSSVEPNVTLQATRGVKGLTLGKTRSASKRSSRISLFGGNASALRSNDDISAPNEVSAEARSRTTMMRSRSPSRNDSTMRSVEPPPKPAKRWAFLQRSKTPSKSIFTQGKPDQPHGPRQMPNRSIAHYAMMGGGKPTVDVEELEKIMQEAEGSSNESKADLETERILRARRKGKAPIRHGDSVLLPEPPKFLQELARPALHASPKVLLQNAQSSQTKQPSEQSNPRKVPAQTSIVGDARPSRLPQVGRIPQVVSKGDRDRKISNDSFSRPFQASQPSPALQNGFALQTPLSSLRHNNGGTASFSDRIVESPKQILKDSPQDSAHGNRYDPPADFLKINPRKDSGQSTSSSSSGTQYLTATTAIPPRRNAPLTDDEVWDEYDDVLDMLAAQTPKMPRKQVSTGVALDYTYCSPMASPVVFGNATFEHYNRFDQPAIPSVGAFAKRIRVPSVRGSRILSSIPSASTFRLSEFVSGYGERNLSMVGPSTGRLSITKDIPFGSSPNVRHSLPVSTRRPSFEHEPSQDFLSQKRTLSDPSATHRASVNLVQADTAYMGFENLAALRFGALMTSKWLSFGRVLFSPARKDDNDRSEKRILVIDGLGKDWSFFVALSYPNASVYSLSGEAGETPTNAATPIQSLPNHYDFCHPSLHYPFPFPKGFFAVVVMRFPIATSESAYKSALFECKRVLQPGGYLEISSLDMDMLNMGSKARSALRSLKIRIQAHDPNVSLKPLSDTIQRLLYRRGFENLNRCYVGVPAAGLIPGSRDQSPTETQGAGIEGSMGPSSKRAPEGPPLSGNIFCEQGEQGEEGMAKHVSRVARWWYSRCYEGLVLRDGDMRQSIWADAAMIRECESRGTSLRMMICYAQKPVYPVRRTISV